MAKPVQMVSYGLILLVGVLLGIILCRSFIGPIKENFTQCTNPDGTVTDFKPKPPTCTNCNGVAPCKCPNPRPICPPCRAPDLSAYVLKSTVPPCPAMPDLSKYMLKTECPPVPDLSNYVLKSSVPRPQPVLLDCTKCNKPKGDCPPCPRPRCPEVKCPEPTKCPTPAPCPRQTCPPTVVKCKAEDAPIQQVRPYLAPLSVTGFGM
jgi:hypothetical protein